MIVKKKIKSLRRLPNSLPTYNIEVVDNHNYFANNILCHNCDDPHNVGEADSELVRESTLRWWSEVMTTRLNDPKKDCKVIIMQRVHSSDLSGYVLKDQGYCHLCLPAEFEPSRKCVTVLGWEDPRTEPNELLWPERVGPQEIEKIKKELGPTAYAGQYQQIPTPAGGGRFKQSYFRYYINLGGELKLFKANGDFEVVNKNECWSFAMLDPAGMEKRVNEKACFSVAQYWLVTPKADMCLIHQMRIQAETPDVADKCVADCRRFDVGWLGIEKNGLGLGIVQTIMRKGIGVVPINATSNKEARSEYAEIRMAAGKVYFEQGNLLNFELEKELLLFPNGEYMDQADCISWSCKAVQDRHGAPVTEQDIVYQETNQDYQDIPTAGQFNRVF